MNNLHRKKAAPIGIVDGADLCKALYIFYPTPRYPHTENVEARVEVVGMKLNNIFAALVHCNPQIGVLVETLCDVQCGYKLVMPVAGYGAFGLCMPQPRARWLPREQLRMAPVGIATFVDTRQSGREHYQRSKLLLAIVHVCE